MKYLLTLLFLFTGCSRMNVAYNLAPRLAANQLEDAFDLSSARYHKIKDTIEKNLKDNKGEIKTELINQIDVIQKVVDQKTLTPAEIKNIFDSGRSLQSKFITLLKPSFDEVLAALSHDELEHLKSYSQEKFKKSEEKFADLDKFKKSQLESFEKNMDTFFNSSTEEQKNLYLEFVMKNLDYYKYQLEVRKNFVSKIESLFDKKTEMVTYIIKYYSGEPSVKSAEFLKKQDVFFANMLETAGVIWKTLTDKQRKDFKKTLQMMRSDLEKL